MLPAAEVQSHCFLLHEICSHGTGITFYFHASMRPPFLFNTGYRNDGFSPEFPSYSLVVRATSPADTEVFVLNTNLPSNLDSALTFSSSIWKLRPVVPRYLRYPLFPTNVEGNCGTRSETWGKPTSVSWTISIRPRNIASFPSTDFLRGDLCRSIMLWH